MGYRLCQGYTRYYTLPPYRFRGPIVFAVKAQPFGVLSVSIWRKSLGRKLRHLMVLISDVESLVDEQAGGKGSLFAFRPPALNEPNTS